LEDKDLGGRPLKFPTPNDLQIAVDVYFKQTPFEKWTVTGLALILGTKQLVQHYEKREGYEEIIRIAKLRIENSYETDLRIKHPTGPIFALKNFGWKDKQEVEHSGGVDVTSRTAAMTKEELEQFVSNLREAKH